MKVYNKLIRDRIPEIIQKAGKNCKVITLKNEDYLRHLNKKLQEELDEYYESKNIEELVDLLEIVYAIAEHHGISRKKIEEMRLVKREKRGGFNKKLFLIEVDD
jgi:predicted house-cleaning noncanonical NTP pyrophosphatase (MazG superfamily)